MTATFFPFRRFEGEFQHVKREGVGCDGTGWGEGVVGWAGMDGTGWDGGLGGIVRCPRENKVCHNGNIFPYSAISQEVPAYIV